LHDLAGLEPALFRASKALPREMSPQEIERRAFDGLARLMRHLAAPTGLVLLLDDLHCSDELSLRFLGQFKRLASSRVAIIANYRSEDAQSVLPAVGAVATRRIDLGPLRPEDTRAMIQDLLASVTLPEGLTALLAHQSEGNPFFVAEYTRALISNGMLQRTPTTGWLLRGHESERLAVPDSIEGLLSLRVQRLSERARATLRLICVLERDFAASTFQALAGAEHDSSEVLEELVAREVLVASSPGRYRFAHDKLREGQERTLGALERRDQHALVARHLEQRVLLLTVGQRATLGFHLARAGEPRRALAYLTPAAAATASAGHTLERAAALYRLAVEQCDALPGEGNALRAPLLEALADVLATQAKHAEARDYLAQWLAELAPDERLARARAFRKTATSHWTVHDYAGAAAALDLAEQELAALAVVPNAEVWSELIQVRIGRFEQLYFAGQIGAELDQLVRELAPLVDARGSADQVCMYYFMASSHAMLRARYAFDESAVRLADRGLQAASGLPAHRVAFAHFNLGFALALGTREQCNQAIAHFELALPHAELAGDVTLLSRIRTYLATTWLRLGNVERTEAAARAALDAAIEAQLAPYVAAAHACQGWSEWKHGRDVEAMSLLEAARTRWKSHPHKFPVQSLALFPLLDLAQLRDDFNAVHTLLEELWTGLPAFPPPLSTAIENAIAALERTAGAEAALAVAEVLRLAQVCAFL
jgi:hypothetical protein